jgi:hypothetical protein
MARFNIGFNPTFFVRDPGIPGFWSKALSSLEKYSTGGTSLT